MKSYLKVALALLLVCAAPSPAQYIGSSRPLGGRQTLDSLAAKADTQSVRILESRANSDSTRLDSVATASAAEDTLLDARIDSVRDNPGGGGGAGAPYATITVGPSGSGADYIYNGTDLSDTLSAAIGAVVDSGGGTVFLLGATYSMTDTTWAKGGGWTLRGERNRTKVNVLGNADYAIYADSAANIELLDIQWIGTDTSYGVFSATRIDTVLISGNEISGFKHASSNIFSTDTLCAEWQIRDNRFHHSTLIEFKGRRSLFDNNNIDSLTAGGLKIWTEHNVVSNNRFRDIGGGNGAGAVWGYYYYAVYSSGFEVTGNVIDWQDPLGVTGVLVEGSGTWIRSVSIRDNTIGSDAYSGGGQSWRGITFTGGAHGFITGNRIKQAANIGIYTTSPETQIIGNYIESPAGPVLVGIYTNANSTAIITNVIKNADVGINIIAGTKSGHSENFFQTVTTNVTDSGTLTVVGDIRDLD